MSSKRSWLFWIGAALVFYTYLGYPILAAFLARTRRRPVKRAPITPGVTIVIPAYNEAGFIGEKIENCKALDYPEEKLEIMVVADGSTDSTVQRAQQYKGIQVMHEPEARGKAAAINRVMPLINSDIVLITDANALLEPGSLRAMVSHFADPLVGGVAGEKRVSDGGEGLYWRYESFLKKNDSQFGSVMGAAGEIFALRHSAFMATEEDTILDDFIISMRLVAAGWRVVYEPQAVARELSTPSLADDFERRARNAAGGIQAILRLPEMADPRLGRTAWQYLSHRVLRWAITPYILPQLFLLNLSLVNRPFYRFLMAGQLAFYGSALVGYNRSLKGREGGLIGGIFYFCLANLATIAGAWRYLSGRQSVPWKKTGRMAPKWSGGKGQKGATEPDDVDRG